MLRRPPLSNHTLSVIHCPSCTAEMILVQGSYSCTTDACGKTYPIMDGIPVLLDEERSIFSIRDFLNEEGTFYERNTITSTATEKKRKKRKIQIGKNYLSERNVEQFLNEILKSNQKPKVLIIGGSRLGPGIKSLLEDARVELVESDVAFGPRTQIICDAHCLPFKAESFDGVIAQAVLEHVIDPRTCVEELHRVLKREGIAFAEVPFIQQVHGGRYDFFRFTHVGLRRLFNGFSEISSGVTCGPGMALAWSYMYFLTSFFESRFIRKYIGKFARMTSFYLKYFDKYLITRRGSLDAASGYFFLGRKSETFITDEKILESYNGLL